ncbi:hypothetical protein CANINC_003456 [Pichia inconspicua]|uniref:Uncharacterized protein n=1 Tax=Pichia inconspicua TaxID=52247 RepID=A0A4T0WYZ2_9ASCO|nr:hypothetical protein CANINC_003456 [[Candida] inconspicua]
MSLETTDSIPSPNIDKSANILSQWGVSPFPAWAFTGALLGSPLLRPSAAILNNPQSTGSNPTKIFANAAKQVGSYPTNPQVLLFSAFVGLGGFMCYDKDPVNGSAVISVWSLLYVLSNAKKAMWNFKLYPKVLTTLALANSTIYGAKYFNVI